MAAFEVRPAVIDDALPIIALLRDLEPDNDLLFYGLDPTRTDADQSTLIETLPDNSQLLVAEAGGEVVGYLECHGGTFPAVQHSARLAVLVRSDWRNRGIGTALMQHVIEWAHTNPIIHRLESEILTSNIQAIRRYEKLGFKIEGTKIRAYFKDGKFIDALQMRLITEDFISWEFPYLYAQSNGEFIGFVAHEIITPLTSISGYASLLLMDMAGELNERQSQFINVLRSNSENVKNLITDLMNWVRIQEGTLYLGDGQTIELPNLLEKVRAAFQAKLDMREQSLDIVLTGEMSNFVSYEERISLILEKLVDNSHLYASTKSHIQINGELIKENNGTLLQLSVMDTGIGISQDELQQVFRPFFRSIYAFDGNPYGHGLGLTIARGLVERMGGEMWIESEVGVGTTVNFTLPVADAQASGN